MNIAQIVRHQVLMEGPQIADGCREQDVAEAREIYVDGIINQWSNVEFLQRISNAITESLK